jgi:radical SAM protein with 4Fe4S-binding SPASM domain
LHFLRRKRTLIHKKFQITWDGGSIIYSPASGTIQAATTTSAIKIHKNPQSHFPDFGDVPSDLLLEKYKPFCLTIYPSHYCNLSCSYCYIPVKRESSTDNIDLSLVIVAAEIVANNCIDQNMPFILGFHGGNEPLINPEIINKCIEICRKVADNHGLALIVACTTNGVISEKIADWAARTFDAITLSWDGPPEINDQFRVQFDGASTSSIVQRTAEILLNSANGLKQFKVRTTVTSKSVHRLLEIAKFFHQQKVSWIEFYPVFQDHAKSIPEDLMPPTTAFVKNFLIARQWARQYGMTIGYAGSRLADFHDRYCPIYQHNLTITPDGFLTACFLITHNTRDINNQYIYGRYDQRSDRIIINWHTLNNMFQQLGQPYSHCRTCFNYYHCAKGCPTVCPLNFHSTSSDRYDCTMEKWIGLANILAAAGFELTENQLQRCEDFFPNIVVEMISNEKLYGTVQDNN